MEQTTREVLIHFIDPHDNQITLESLSMLRTVGILNVLTALEKPCVIQSELKQGGHYRHTIRQWTLTERHPTRRSEWVTIITYETDLESNSMNW